MGSSRDASVPDFRFRRSEKMPSSNFLEFLTGRPKAWNRNERHRTMSVPEMWKRLFLDEASVLLQLIITPFHHIPQNARDVLARRQEEAANVLIRLPVNGGRNEEVFH